MFIYSNDVCIAWGAECLADVVEMLITGNLVAKVVNIISKKKVYRVKKKLY